MSRDIIVSLYESKMVMEPDDNYCKPPKMKRKPRPKKKYYRVTYQSMNATNPTNELPTITVMGFSENKSPEACFRAANKKVSGYGYQSTWMKIVDFTPIA